MMYVLSFIILVDFSDLGLVSSLGTVFAVKSLLAITIHLELGDDDFRGVDGDLDRGA